MLILFLPWAFKGKWLEEKKLLAGFSLLLSTRYFSSKCGFAILADRPAAGDLFVYGVFNIYLSIKRPVCLLGSCSSPAGTAFMWKYFRDGGTLALSIGAESRNEYLTRTLPEYSAFVISIGRRRRMRKFIFSLSAGERIIASETIFTTAATCRVSCWARFAPPNAEQIEQSLRQNQITHLMAREDLLTGFLSNNLTPDQAHLWNEFAASRLRLGFRDRGYAVYQLHG